MMWRRFWHIGAGVEGLIRHRWPRTVGVVVLLTIVCYMGARAMSPSFPAGEELVVYGFSTQQEVMTYAVFPLFEAEWREKTGQAVAIRGVFGPSRAVAGKINLGAPADIALFSHERDAEWLKLGRRVKDVVTVPYAMSPIVIVTRPGNPHNLRSFADLTKAGVVLLHPDPRQSGAGVWAVLAEYGSVIADGGSPEAALRQLGAIWRNVRVVQDSARLTLTLFELGAGDALVTYEADALLARSRGVDLEIVMPDTTIVARHVAVVVDANVRSEERPVAEGFVRYLAGPEGARALARFHMRPTSPNAVADGFPALRETFTIDLLGGWPRAYADIYEGRWAAQIAPRLQLDSLAPEPEALRSP